MCGAQSHLSWGALLYRFDDGDPVSLFQGKAIASITGPYLGKTTRLPSAKSQASRHFHRAQTHTHAHQKLILLQTDSTHVSIWSLLRKECLLRYKIDFCSVLSFPSHSCVLPNDTLFFRFVLGCGYIRAKLQHKRQTEG